MKINFEFNDDDVAFEIMDSMFVAYLKNFKKDCEKYYIESWNPEDKKTNKRLVKSCDEILKHFEVQDAIRY